MEDKRLQVVHELDENERMTALGSMSDNETRNGHVLFDLEVPFGDGRCGVVQVVSARPGLPYVNPFLLDENGHEIDLLDVADSVIGTFVFHDEGVAYELTVS